MSEKARRILVIDDSEVMLSRIKRVLVEAGYDVIATDQVVGNGRHMKACDLAIIDFHMPGFSGDAVTASLRSASAQCEKPCALYLYTTDQAAMQKYASLGFDGYFSDKGDEAALVRQVQSAFRLLNIRAMSRKVMVG
jgi:two-component system OmpR family response regulator